MGGESQIFWSRCCHDCVVGLGLSVEGYKVVMLKRLEPGFCVGCWFKTSINNYFWQKVYRIAIKPRLCYRLEHFSTLRLESISPWTKERII